MSERNLHRNNAAEWLMVIAIAPVVFLIRVISIASSRLRG
jgi:hypothetical protein